MSKKKDIEEIRALRSRKAKLESVSRDTSEHKQAEQLIEQLAKFPSENPYPVLRVSGEGKVLYANQASKLVLEGRNSREGALAPADWRRAAEEALKSGSVIRIEAKHKDKTFAFRIVPVVNAGYCNFYGADITERKKAEERISFLAEIVKSSPLSVITTDKNARIAYVNPTTEKLFGYKAEELIGKDPGILNAEPDPVKSQKEMLDSIAQKNYWKGEMLNRKKNGEVFHLGASVFRLHDEKGNFVATVGFQEDITERKQAEEALRVHGQIIANMSEGVYIIRANDGVIVYTNPKFEQMLDYGPGELVGKNVSVVNAPTERTPEKTAKKIIKVLNEKGSWRGEILNIRKDGTPFWCYASVSTFEHPEHGNVWISMHTDITERKQAEKKLLDYQAQLKSLASQLTLTEERERRRIAADLHDQISQSLVISKIKLDTLRSSAPSEELAKELNEISDSLYQTVQDIRSLTFDLSFPVLYELGFEAAVAAWLVEQIQEKYGIKSEFEDDEQPKPLDDDVRVLLFRNMRELLINVVKHANANKVKVSVRRADNRIHVSVEDDGVGFDVAKVMSTSAKRGGFGLFSIRERLEELGGYLEIESKPGYGTKVTLMAPLKQQNTKGRQK